MKFYFNLQYKRIYRIIDSTGFNPLLAVLIAISLFIFASNLLFDRIESAQIVYPLLSLFFFLKLSGKSRNDFIRNVFKNSKYKKLRIIENLILAIPFFIFMIYKHIYVYSFIFLFIVIAISQFNKIASINFVLPTPFYKKPFEFIVGFRSTFWLFPIAYFITYIAISVQNFNLGLFSLIVVLLTPLSFYIHPEHPFFVWVHSTSPSGFLYRKIKTAIISSLSLGLPVVVSLLIFFSKDNYDLIITISIIALFLLVTSVIGKYSLYPSETPVQILLIIACIVFPPFLLFVLPYFYSKSNKTLKNYLNEYRN